MFIDDIESIEVLLAHALPEGLANLAVPVLVFLAMFLADCKLDATDEEILAAAGKAQCNEFLERLENGIRTMAGDGGKQLSGGERQRISLARAILKNAPIVVLDEATAFMDPENEEKMNEAIAEVIKGKTVIVIAHRLHSIVNADQICVLKGGNLAAIGTHKELLERCDEYGKLWRAAEGSTKWKVSTAKGDENK